MSDLNSFLDILSQHLTAEQVFERDFNHDWQKTPSKWRGKCPVHESKSGTAFYMRPDTLQWYCPFDKIGGGAIQYLSLLKTGNVSPRGKDFIDIAKELAAVAGLDFPERDISPQEQLQADRLENRRAMLQSVYAICNAALTERSKIALAYVKERGFSDDDVENLNLGVFPSASEVVEKLTAQGFAFEDIQESGIAYKQHDGGYGSSLERYITIPWLDEYGRPLTLYGRYMQQVPPEGKPKTTALRNPGKENEVWLSSKKSPLYFDRARSENGITVVEGVFDAALLQCRGDSSVVAWVAANPSEQQLDTLEKHKVGSITFALDPDAAGDAGTLAAIKRCVKRGFSTFVMPRLPEGVDPDEFVIDHGIDAWHQLKNEAINGLRHVARFFYKDIETDKKLAVAKASAEDFAASLKGFESDLNAYFWDEVSIITNGKIKAPKPSNIDQILDKSNEEGESIDFEGALKIVGLLRETYKDEFEFQWNLKSWVRSSGIQKLGINESFLLAAYEARRVPKKPIIDREISYSELCKEPDDTSFIVKGFIPAHSVIVLCAEGGTGKTSLALDIQRHIANGTKWSGLETNQGVCYNVQTDSPKHDVKRILKIQSYWDVPSSNVVGIHRWSINEWESLKDRLNEVKPRLVIIDSFTSIHADSGFDLTKSSGGDSLYKFRDYVEDADWDISFLIIHHTNKGGTLRDSSSIKDNASGLYYLYKPTEELKKKYNLSRYDVVLDIDKSRQGLAGQYRLTQNPMDYSWEFNGLLEEGDAFDDCISHLKNTPGKASAIQVAEFLNFDLKAVAASLDRAAQMGRIKCDYRIEQKDKNGNPYRFPIYWNSEAVGTESSWPEPKDDPSDEDPVSVRPPLIEF